MSSVVISGDTSGAITLAAPAVAGTNTLSLPAVTDTLVGLAATQTLTNKSIAATQLTGTIAAARLPAGSVLQVVQTSVTTASSVSVTTSKADIPNLSVAITPTASASKILIMWKIMYSNSSVDGAQGYLQRNGTDIGVGTTGSIGNLATIPFLTANSNSYWGFDASGSFLDSPATTSSTTYKFQINSQNSITVYFNRSGRGDPDGCYISTITAMEIAA
jgi:hypothetical protein